MLSSYPDDLRSLTYKWVRPQGPFARLLAPVLDYLNFSLTIISASFSQTLEPCIVQYFAINLKSHHLTNLWKSDWMFKKSMSVTTLRNIFMSSAKIKKSTYLKQLLKSWIKIFQISQKVWKIELKWVSVEKNYQPRQCAIRKFFSGTGPCKIKIFLNENIKDVLR